MPLLRLWFGPARVDRAAYLRWGVTLMLAKYLLDATVAWAVTGAWWTPWRYLSPLWSVRMAQFPHGPYVLFLVLGLIVVPFFWIGVSMSVRRASDAGLDPVAGLGFAVPIVNWLVMLLLAVTPSRAGGPARRTASMADEDQLPGMRSALTGVALTAPIVAALLGVGMALLTARHIGTYGLALFFGTPLLMGVISGYAVSYRRSSLVSEAILSAVLASLLAAGALLLLALEGVICLAMAAPLMLPIAIIGALVGRALAQHQQPALGSLLVVVLALPALGAAERVAGSPTEHVVLTSIEIDAPPEIVWQQVIGFTDLEPPTEWLFRTGIAYPVRARLVGTGVGAIRHCEFSTGAFVEPITAWEPGARLAFDVQRQPTPMHEWSFYASVHPPHLDTLLRSQRGEFRLIRRADGGTRLEGRTWYQLTAAPTGYWSAWSHAIIGQIHRRVLKHVRKRSEAAARVAHVGSVRALQAPAKPSDTSHDDLRRPRSAAAAAAVRAAGQPGTGFGRLRGHARSVPRRVVGAAVPGVSPTRHVGERAPTIAAPHVVGSREASIARVPPGRT
jgi:hypothetical protein